MSNYLSLGVIRISIISIIACDFIDIESFDQPLAAILKNGCHGHQGANLRWPNIQFCSQDICQHICQIWCLYHKMNNWFDMLSYTAPLTRFLQNIPFFLHNYFGVGLNTQATFNVVSRKHSRRYRMSYQKNASSKQHSCRQWLRFHARRCVWSASTES